MKAIDYIVLVVALLLIVLIMSQESKDNIQDAFSGEKTDLFKNQKQRGPVLLPGKSHRRRSLVGCSP